MPISSWARNSLAALALLALLEGCVRIGVGVTNAPTIPDCIPGSATRPCN